jgi:hypothetical protein
VRYGVLLTEKNEMEEIVPGSEFLLTWQGPAWTDLRQRLARAARELHFVAYAGDSANVAFLLSSSEKFAELALSIPVGPERQAPGVRFPGNLVDAQTLLAAHILKYDEATSRDTPDAPTSVRAPSNT